MTAGVICSDICPQKTGAFIVPLVPASFRNIKPCIIQTLFLVVKCRRHLCKQITYFQMLRTYSLTFSTFDTVRCPSVAVSGYDVVVIIPSVPVMKSFMCIKCRKQVGDANPSGALTLFDAVSACSTGYQVQHFKNIAHLPYRRVFCLARSYQRKQTLSSSKDNSQYHDGRMHIPHKQHLG